MGNKVDDAEHEEISTLVEQARIKSVEIFGEGCSKDSMTELLGIISSGQSDLDKKVVAFLPISARNAFYYRKAKSLTMDQFNDFDETFIDMVGREEVGRKWKAMSAEEKYNVVRDAVANPKEYQERLDGTNFDTFMSVFWHFIGGPDIQLDLITFQIETKKSALTHANANYICRAIHDIYTQCKALGLDCDDIPGYFWNVYNDCEKSALLSLEDQVSPHSLQLPFLQLQKYYDIATEFSGKVEMLNVLEKMTSLVF